MEENSNYTYTYKRENKKKGVDKKLFLIFVIAVIVLILLAVLFGSAAGKSSAQKKIEKENTTTPENTTEEITDEVITLPYELGDYTVDTGDYSLKFRKNYSTDADVILEIASGTRLSITEIYRDETAEAAGSEVVYWGQTSYYGYTGWVAMNYLKKAYSDSIVTPDQVTTTEEPSSEDATGEEPSAEPPQTPDDNEEPTGEETTLASSSRYNPGDYVVNSGAVGLRFKKTPAANGEVITVIPSGSAVTVLRVVEVEADDEVYRYWGEVSYQGSTGYVSMAYLKKAN